MKHSITFVVTLISLLMSLPALAIDRVKLHAGGQNQGEVTEMSPTEVTLKLGQTEKKFAVNEIDTITFTSEPNDLGQARIAVRDGRYGDAQAHLEKLDNKKSDRPAIQQDIEFYRAVAAVRLALAGSGSKADAGRRLLAFEKAHKNNYHYLEACEVLGDLFASLGKYDQAETYYERLASAPWPEYKQRASVLVGRALVGQKQYDGAVTRFNEALAAKGEGKEYERQKLAASLGKASALAGLGKNDEAIAEVNKIIAAAEPENLELHARAYNVLGNCYKAAGKKKDALLAFLHVDLLYGRFAEQHAEALANLATLWTEVDKADRATAAKNLLKEKYPGSAWAQ
jgi:tetratricopeptide (TPR) repeat protein